MCGALENAIILLMPSYRRGSVRVQNGKDIYCGEVLLFSKAALPLSRLQNREEGSWPLTSAL